MKRLVILDLDNTLYSWMDAFAPSFRAQVHILARELNLDEKLIMDDFKRVFARHGTVEYPDALLELDVWNHADSTEEEQQIIQKKARKVYSITWRRNLILYPNVRETLLLLQANSVLIVGLSDSYYQWAERRLNQLGIGRFFHKLYACESPWDERIEHKLHYKLKEKWRKLSSQMMKPNPDIVEKIAREEQVDKRNIFMVGDSLTKDIATAQAAHVADVWARYGTKYKDENRVTLQSITPWSINEQEGERIARNKFRPTYVIDDFSEIATIMCLAQPKESMHIKVVQPTLFDI